MYTMFVYIFYTYFIHVLYIFYTCFTCVHTCFTHVLQLETAQQDNRQLEDARQTAEALAMQTETQLVSERREREGERREREEKMWKLTQQLQALEEVQTQTQAKVLINQLTLYRHTQQSYIYIIYRCIIDG